MAFFGRSGQAILKSLQRLHVDPLAVYGTNCLKFGTESPDDARAWLTRELVHRPAEARRRDGREHGSTSSTSSPSRWQTRPRNAELGVVRRFTPTIEALVTPDVDASLDEQPAKTAFWNAFKALGPWWAEQPPY